MGFRVCRKVLDILRWESQDSRIKHPTDVDASLCHVMATRCYANLYDMKSRDRY